MDIREQARAVVIKRGAGYHSGLIDGTGVENFNALPRSVYRRIVDRARRIYQWLRIHSTPDHT